MQTLREWVDNHCNKLSQVVVKAGDGKDTVYTGLVDSLTGDMLNLYGNAEVLEVTKSNNVTKVLISGDVIDPVNTKMRFKIYTSAEESRWGEIDLTYAQAKVIDYASDSGNWVWADDSCYSGSFGIDLESARVL